MNPRAYLTCLWAGRRLNRYLDADPSATLSPDEVARLEMHLAVCVRCGPAYADLRRVKAALAGWQRTPDPAAITRLKALVDELGQGSR